MIACVRPLSYPLSKRPMMDGVGSGSATGAEPTTASNPMAAIMIANSYIVGCLLSVPRGRVAREQPTTGVPLHPGGFVHSGQHLVHLFIRPALPDRAVRGAPRANVYAVPQLHRHAGEPIKRATAQY